MSKKGENIRKRVDGRWECRIRIGRYPNGNIKYKSVYGKSYTDCRNNRDQFMMDHPDLYLYLDAIKSEPSGPVRFDHLLIRWIEHKRPQIKESSYLHYYELINTHLVPGLGKIRVDRLTDQKINRFLREKAENGQLTGKGGLSPRTVLELKNVIQQSLRYALGQGYISVMPDITYLSSPATGNVIRVLSIDEQNRLELTVRNKKDAFRWAILIPLYCGLRIGEVCGLKWKDVDLDEGTIYISRTLQRLHNSAPYMDNWKTKLELKDPKTRNSIRQIPIPENILRELRVSKSMGEHYVISGSADWVDPKTCLDRYHKILKTAHVKTCGFHTLRHTFATRSIEMGVDVKTLSEIMGHAGPTITLKTYVHPSLMHKKSEINKLNDVYGKVYHQL